MGSVKVKIVNKSKYGLPKYQTNGSAGMDLHANVERPLVMQRNKVYLVPTGLFISIPNGYEAQIRARSGLSLKYGITLVNGIGTIDSDYRGEIKIIMMNLGESDFTIKPGDRIAQMVINKYENAQFVLVDYLDETERGRGGFGHSKV